MGCADSVSECVVASFLLFFLPDPRIQEVVSINIIEEFMMEENAIGLLVLLVDVLCDEAVLASSYYGMCLHQAIGKNHG